MGYPEDVKTLVLVRRAIESERSEVYMQMIREELEFQEWHNLRLIKLGELLLHLLRDPSFLKLSSEERVRKVWEEVQSLPVPSWAKDIFWQPALGPKELVAQIEALSAVDLMRMDIEPPAWIVEDILPEGITLLSGVPKIGKSWLALNVALGVASGGMVLGHKVTKPLTVLYLALEDGKARIKSRLSVMLQGDPPPPSLNFVFSWDRAIGLALLDYYLEHNPVDFVIIDHIWVFMSRPTSKQRKYFQDMYEAELSVFSKLAEIVHRHGVSLLFTTHERKTKSDDFIDMAIGTRGVTGGPDTIWRLTRKRAQFEGKLEITGRDISELELAIKFSPEIGTWQLLGDATWWSVSEQRSQIIEVMKDLKGPVGAQELADALGWKVSNVRFHLMRMHRDGVVERVKRGLYRLVQREND
jgi:hypothetical protein